MAITRFEGNEFAIQVIAKGAFVDEGTGNGKSYIVEATTIRMNHVALEAWIMSQTMNHRECYETQGEWEAHQAKYAERRKVVTAQIAEALEIDSTKGGFSITQSQSEVFTVVHICEVAKVYKRNGMNCVDLNGTYTYLPDDLSMVHGKWIDGEFYSEIVIVQTSV